MVIAKETENDINVIELIKSSPYFHGLEEEDYEQIGRLMQKREVAKKEIIWLEEEPSSTIYLTASGLVKLFKTASGGKEQILRLAGPGDCFGHAGALNGGSHPESAQAVVRSVIYGIPSSEFRALLAAHHRLSSNTIKALADEMHHYISLVEDLSLRYVTSRLARILLTYSEDGLCDSSLSMIPRADLAAMAGTVREVAVKSLSSLEKMGVIEFSEDNIVIVDNEELKVIAEWR